MTQAPSFVQPQTAPQDRLDKLKELAQRARDLKFEIEDLDNRAAEKRKEQTRLLQEEMPALMDECNARVFGLQADGNLPAYDLELCPFYSANIAASWEEERRKEAFDYLESIGEGDLIKTVIMVPFPREQRRDALQLSNELRKRGITTAVTETVHTQTLTAWLRKQVEKKNKLPDLLKIGGQVGRTVKLKEKKDT